MTGKRGSGLRCAFVLGGAWALGGGSLLAQAGDPPADEAPKRVLFVRGADRSGGFLEAGNDTQRTEQLADIDNLSTSNRNHGWGSFRIALEDAGYVVSQIEERAENESGPSEGIAIDLSRFALSRWDLLVFGSNNASYTPESVDALETWIREDGGSALFISDANFGGSWKDAPDSDQPFLTRFGLVVNQDQGTYVLRRSSGDFPNPGHPVLAGIDAFDGEGVSPFVLNQLAVPEGTTLTRLAAAKNNTRNNDGTNPGNNFQGSSRSSTANDASLVAIEAGHGRVIGHFDRNTFFNLNGAGTNLTRFDNTDLGLNMIGWLTGRIDPITPYEGFAQTHFASLPGGRDDPQAAFEVDFDFDGLANGIEHVLGTDPTSPTSGPSHTITLVGDDPSLLVADPIPADVALVLQATDSLEADDWEAIASRPVGGSWTGPVSETPEGEFTRLTVAQPTSPRRFFRLSVQIP